MGILILLESARLAGLEVAVIGDKLTVTGPKSAAAVVKELAARKAEVVEHLAARRVLPSRVPDCILAGPKVDPFAAVAVASPMAPPPPAIPSYRIPASGPAAMPLKVTPITEAERSLDSKAVAAACYAYARSVPVFKDWPYHTSNKRL